MEIYKIQELRITTKYKINMKQTKVFTDTKNSLKLAKINIKFTFNASKIENDK